MEDEAKADKERVIKLDDEQVTREQLIDIVRQCVKDSLVAGAKGGGFKLRQAGDDGAAAAAAAAAGGVTEEDVIRAADMLLDQCGEDRVEEEEEEDFASLTEARVPRPLPLVTPAGGGRAWRRRMRAECESDANLMCFAPARLWTVCWRASSGWWMASAWWWRASSGWCRRSGA